MQSVCVQHIAGVEVLQVELKGSRGLYVAGRYATISGNTYNFLMGLILGLECALPKVVGTALLTAPVFQHFTFQLPKIHNM